MPWAGELQEFLDQLPAVPEQSWKVPEECFMVPTSVSWLRIVFHGSEKCFMLPKSVSWLRRASQI